MLPNVGFGELLLIVIVALVVFGPNRLPEMMRSAGKALRSFQRESSKAMEELRGAVEPLDIRKDLDDVAAVANAPPIEAPAVDGKVSEPVKKAKSTTRRTGKTAKSGKTVARRAPAKKGKVAAPEPYPATEDT